MTLLTIYDARVKLVILASYGAFEWLVLPSHAPDYARRLAYSSGVEYTKSQAVIEGRRKLEFWAEQLSAISEGAIFQKGRQGTEKSHGQ